MFQNDLEKVVLPAYPQVAQLRAAFAEAEILGLINRQYGNCHLLTELSAYKCINTC